MATKARAGVGATFEVDTGSGYSYVADLVTIGGPEASAEQVEATSLDSTGGYKEYIPGALDGGTISLTLRFNNGQAQRQMRALVGSITLAHFRITLPTSPMATYMLDGNVTAWTQSAEANAPMEAEITIKASGRINWTVVASFAPPTTLSQTITSQSANGHDSPTSGYVVPISTINSQAGYSQTTLDSGAIQHFSFVDSGINIRKNAVITSAVLRFKSVSPGANAIAAGGRFYAKKVGQATTVVNTNAGNEWYATAGVLTTAYVEWTPAAGTINIDVAPLINELLLSSEWDETNGKIQFIYRLNGAQNVHVDSTWSVNFDRYDGGAYLFNLTIIYNDTANPETGAIRDGFVINYLPVNANDCTVVNTLRFVVQNNANGRESTTIVAPVPASFTSTTRDTSRQTIKINGGLAELHATWANPTPQARMFGRKFTDHPDFTSADPSASLLRDLEQSYAPNDRYHDGWLFEPTRNDYLWVFATEWTSGDVLNSWWDLWNYPTYFSDSSTWQSAMFLTTAPATGTIELDMQTGQRTVASISGLTAGAGRTLRGAVMWDHVAAAWRYKFVVEDSNGATLVERAGTLSAPRVYPRTEIDQRWLVGFRLDGGARLFGHIFIEWRGTAAAIWESTADQMGTAWIKGIKSIDPRLMA